MNTNIPQTRKLVKVISMVQYYTSVKNPELTQSPRKARQNNEKWYGDKRTEHTQTSNKETLTQGTTTTTRSERVSKRPCRLCSY